MLATAYRASRFMSCCKQLNSVKPILFAPQNLNIIKYQRKPINTTSVSFQDEQKKSLKLSEENFVQRMYNKIFSGVPVAKLRASGYILLTSCSQGRKNIDEKHVKNRI